LRRRAIALLFSLSLVGASDAAGVLNASEAAAIAVNDLSTTDDGFALTRPRHRAEVRADGVSFRSATRGPQWRWNLTTIRAGRAELPTHETPPVHAGPSRIDYVRGGVTERYLLHATNVEQQFVLPAPIPNAKGDLEIEGTVQCDGRFSRTERGWSWRDDDGEVHLGNVTVLDAAGKALAATMEVTPGGTRIVVDGHDLACATYPVTIDPEIRRSCRP
jgi:hypothetical protein